MKVRARRAALCDGGVLARDSEPRPALPVPAQATSAAVAKTTLLQQVAKHWQRADSDVTVCLTVG